MIPLSPGSESAPLGAQPLAGVLGGVIALPISSLLLVLLRNGLGRPSRVPWGAWLAGSALASAMAYLVGLVAIGRGSDLANGAAWAGAFPWMLVISIAAAMLVAWLTGARSTWHPAGVAVLGSLALATTGWASFLVTDRVHVLMTAPTLWNVGLVAFMTAQLAGLGFLLAAAWYVLDALVRSTWSRTSDAAPFDASYLPKVAVHVACYNEPFKVVERTLDSIAKLDYPRDRMVLMLVDDSSDPHDVAKLRAACAARGIAFVHREVRTGYKAGALNAALRATPRDVEIIAHVDADYIVDPSFLRQTVGYFVDPEVAIVQTRLAYRNNDESFTSRYASHMEDAFYICMMPTRNESNSIFFTGTMGLLRRSSIEAAGGWTEGHVGEDVDLSCRILLTGRTSLYVPKTFGVGLQTTTQEAFRKQQARWAYGGTRIIVDHARKIATSRMSAAQKAHYLVSPFFWTEGLLATAFSLILAVFALAFVSGALGPLPASRLLFVGLIPIVYITEGALRNIFTMRRLLKLRGRDVLMLVLLGWSSKFSNGASAWAAFWGVPRSFQRTPKTSGRRVGRGDAMRYAIRNAPVETALASLQLTLGIAMLTRIAIVGTGGAALPLILAASLMTIVWAGFFAAAPVCTYLAHRTTKGSGEPARSVNAKVVAG